MKLSIMFVVVFVLSLFISGSQGAPRPDPKFNIDVKALKNTGKALVSTMFDVLLKFHKIYGFFGIGA